MTKGRMLLIHCLHGQSRRFPNHDWDDPDGFDAIARVIVSEWGRRRGEPNLKLEDKPRPWLTRTVYEFLEPILKYDEVIFDSLCKERIQNFSSLLKVYRGPPDRFSPFFLGVTAIFAHKPREISPHDRTVIAQELWFAFRHYIPPLFLPGFLLQVRPRGIAHHISMGEIAEEYHDWIVRHLAKFNPAYSARGEYSPDIVEAAQTLREQIIRKSKKPRAK